VRRLRHRLTDQVGSSLFVKEDSMSQRITAATPVVDFSLDVRFAGKGPAVGELMNDTSDT
jgi:hypothetical protein